MWHCLGVYLARVVQRFRRYVLTGDLIAERLRMLIQHLEVLVFESVAEIDSFVFGLLTLGVLSQVVWQRQCADSGLSKYVSERKQTQTLTESPDQVIPLSAKSLRSSPCIGPGITLLLICFTEPTGIRWRRIHNFTLKRKH